MTSHAGKDLGNNNLEIKIPTFTTLLSLRGISIPHKSNNLEILKLNNENIIISYISTIQNTGFSTQANGYDRSTTSEYIINLMFTGPVGIWTGLGWPRIETGGGRL